MRSESELQLVSASSSSISNTQFLYNVVMIHFCHQYKTFSAILYSTSTATVVVPMSTECTNLRMPSTDAGYSAGVNTDCQYSNCVPTTTSNSHVSMSAATVSNVLASHALRFRWALIDTSIVKFYLCIKPIAIFAAGTGIGNAQVGGVCSWMLSPLAADPGNPKCFLQCHPAPGNVYCGRWVRMPCAPGTIFDVTVQVCVHDPCKYKMTIKTIKRLINSNNLLNFRDSKIYEELPSHLTCLILYTLVNPPGPVIPQPQCNCGCQTGTMIGSCNSNYQCPGSSVCQMSQISSCQQQCNVCCYSGSFGGK